MADDLGRFASLLTARTFQTPSPKIDRLKKGADPSAPRSYVYSVSERIFSVSCEAEKSVHPARDW